jgi:Putative sugar-binding domain
MSIPPDLLRTFAELVFEKNWNKQRLAEWLREAKIIPSSNDPKDTRGVQAIINIAGKYLLGRDDGLSEIEDLNILTLTDGPLFEKYPSLVLAKIIEANPRGRPWDQRRPVHAIDNPAFYTSQVAADFLSTAISARTPQRVQFHIGFSGGLTVHQVVSRMRPILSFDTHFYPAAVPWYFVDSADHISPETNATIAWTHSGMPSGRLHPYSVPPATIVPQPDETEDFQFRDNSRQLRKHLGSLRNDSSVKFALKDISSFNCIVTNVDTVLPHEREFANVPVNIDPILPWWNKDQVNASTLLQSYGIDVIRLAADGAVGSINYTFFDKDGNDKDEWRLFLTPGYPASLEHYRQTVKDGETIIVVCTDYLQIPALKIAARTGLFNTLITDSTTAVILLED